jgi:hypothetical protein
MTDGHGEQGIAATAVAPRAEINAARTALMHTGTAVASDPHVAGHRSEVNARSPPQSGRPEDMNPRAERQRSRSRFAAHKTTRPVLHHRPC